MKSWRIALAAAGMLLSLPAFAQTLTIGVSSEPLSMDPQFTRAAQTQAMVAHMFNRLVEPGRTGQTTPNLAIKWENVDPLTWIVHLRPGVTFHDGSPLTAADVVYSMERAPKVPNSPASYAAAVAAIKTMDIVDDLTIKFTTKTPSPMFIEDIGYVYIVSKKLTEGKATSDFNSGAIAIGTGAYKLVSWKPGDRMELVRNDKFWGEKPAYEKVVIRFIANDAARIAALRSGAVDLIDQVPPVDVPGLKSNPDVVLSSAATYRIIYLALNQDPKALIVSDAKGQPMTRNPLTDKRVRHAISLMIDRQAIVDRLLSGAGEPANQFVNSRTYGFNQTIPPIKADIAGAKKLLAEAGYPDGFTISVHSSNDRFPQDGELAQVLGQMFVRGGLKVSKVEALPFAVYSKEANGNKYPAFTYSYGNATAESLRGLLASLHSMQSHGDVGTLNRFDYASKEVDAKLDAAAQEFDAVKRENLLKDAAKLIHDDTAFVPLYFQSLYWATRKGVDFDAWSDERTLAMRAKPAAK
jgi:peptide/nickel transport system substrate-binding protein